MASDRKKMGGSHQYLSTALSLPFRQNDLPYSVRLLLFTGTTPRILVIGRHKGIYKIRPHQGRGRISEVLHNLEEELHTKPL